MTGCAGVRRMDASRRILPGCSPSTSSWRRRKWRRACIAQIWYWTREQYAALGELESPLSPIRRRGPKGRSFSAHIRWAGAKLRPLREQTGTRNKVYLQSDAIRVLE
jgi:hypothetical protein